MVISTQISVLENRLSVARVPLSRVLTAADIDRSTWSRWRANKTSPTLKNWEAVIAAVDDLVPPSSEPKTSSTDNTAGHARGPSQHPIHDIAESPRLDAAPEQSGGQASCGGVSSTSSEPPSPAPAGVEPVSQ